MSVRDACFYSLTVPGRRAWANAQSGLPPHYRKILDVIGKVQTAEAIFRALGGPSRQKVQDWLDELETLCFVELAVPQTEARAA